jgi:glycogen synthase
LACWTSHAIQISVADSVFTEFIKSGGIGFVTIHYVNSAASKKSVVAEILADWFGLRKKYKSMMKDAYKSGDKVNGELYNQKQHSLKNTPQRSLRWFCDKFI